MNTYEFEVVGQRYTCKASDKLTAYAAILMYHNNVPHLVMVVAPEECVKDTWMALDGTFYQRLDQAFGGPGRLGQFMWMQKPQVEAAFATIQKVEVHDKAEH